MNICFSQWKIENLGNMSPTQRNADMVSNIVYADAESGLRIATAPQFVVYA